MATETKHKQPRRERKPRSKSRKTAEIIIACVVAVLCLLAIGQAYRFFGSNLRSRDGQEHIVCIYPNTTLDSLVSTLRQDYRVASPLSLRLQGKLLKWPKGGYVRTGRYRIPARTGNLRLIRMLRNGSQEPVRLTFNNIRTKGQLSARLASQLMLDSADIACRLDSAEYMQQYGLNPNTAVSLFLPDTYDMYWDVTPDHLFGKMKDAYDAFWTADRLAAAKALDFEPWQIATIASIVEEETNRDQDKPIIAGLYMNRLAIGMPLQSCPTVKFALQDFSLRRITGEHLRVESPYNTYRNQGLPPGPIRIPTAKTLDFVLHPQQRDKGYLYMCASTAFDGTHHFSTSYAEHSRYARAYQAALNARNIH